MIGTVIHAWCLSVVWRAYAFLGDKKVAQQISQQLSATQSAFHYPDQLLSCVLPQPPPYMEAMNAKQTQDPAEEKEPLNA